MVPTWADRGAPAGGSVALFSCAATGIVTTGQRRRDRQRKGEKSEEGAGITVLPRGRQTREGGR